MKLVRFMILLAILGFAALVGCNIAMVMGMKNPILRVIPEEVLFNPRLLSFYVPVGMLMVAFTGVTIVLLRMYRMLK